MKQDVLLKKAKRAKGNMILGAGAALVALFFIIEANRIKDGKHIMVSAKVFPRIYAGIMLVCATAILISGIREYLAVPKEIRAEDKMNGEQKEGLFRVFLVLLVLLVTAYFFKPVGFLAVTPFTMFSLFLILEEPEKRNYGLFLVLSVLCPVVVYFSFYFLFKNLLPPGVLKPLLYNFL